MAFGDFLKKIGKTLKPPKRIRDWRQLKRQYRAYLRGLPNINPIDIRRGVREWMKNNPKPKRTRKEREKIYSDIPQIYEEGRELLGGNGDYTGASGVSSLTFTGKPPQVKKAGFSPLLLLLLIPVLFPKLLKNF